MPTVTSPEVEQPDELARRDPREVVRKSLISGVAVFIPLAVTLVVLGVVLNFVSTRLNPVVAVAGRLPMTSADPNALVVKTVTVALLVVVIFVVGFVAEFRSGEGRIAEGFDELMASIPGIGSVYTSFDEMSELLLDSDTDSFQEVKLVEYPDEGSYTVAFKTADTPAAVGEATGHEDMMTLFMPLAPNPVMGGFVMHVSADRVVDVDLTVEQGIRSIVTSGVAIGEDVPALRGLSASQLRELGLDEDGELRVAEGDPPGRAEPVVERREHYEDAVAPEHSETPGKIVERHRQSGEPTDMPPDERTSRDSDPADDTDAPPAERAGRDERLREPTRETPAEQAGRDGGRREESAAPSADATDEEDDG